MQSKLPIYAGIHKGQRRWLAEMIVRAGRTDFNNDEEIEWLGEQLELFSAHHKEHAELEERFVHPRVNLIMPGAAREIEEDHVAHHEMLQDLIDSLARIKGISKDHPALPMIGQDFYLALNRFISAYLEHIDFEEGHVQNVLLNDSTAEEIMDIFQQILAAQSPPSLMDNLTLMLTAMNVPEAVDLLHAAKAKLPPDAYESVTAKVAMIVGQERWSVIMGRIGPG